MINLFDILASDDGNQLLSRLYVAIFKFYAEKCPKDAEDAEVGELQYRLKVWTHQVAAKPCLCRVLRPRVHRG